MSFFVSKIEGRERLLSEEDILKDKVDTIEQFYILRYLKDNLNTDNFDLYLLNRNKIKVIDKYNEILCFEYDKQNKEVIYNDYDKSYELEI
jgi:ATP adenylyltransferase/5',5'''-P-1,P-4-tetraphosphate phosphorylase II